MKDDDYPFGKLGDNSIFDDQDLFDKMWKGPFIMGHVEEVFFPVREELLVLFRHWHEVVEKEEDWRKEQFPRDWAQHRLEALSRRDLIGKFLMEEEVDEVIMLIRIERENQKRRGSDEEKSHEEEQAPHRTS